jgi:hypothetical protein
MFASGGDAVPGGRLGPGRAPYREGASGDGGTGGYRTGGFEAGGYGNESTWPSSPEAAAVGVARRLQARLDRHLWLLGQIHPEPTQLRELTDTVRRMRRDAESMVLLNGDDPSGHTGGPRRLSDVLDDAAAVAEETWRILVRPAAAATIEPGAAVEFMYVLAELLDHVTAAYPDAGIDVASYVTARSGLTVEVSVNSASRYVPDGLGTQRAAVTAEAHVRRSRSGLTLTLPPGVPPAGGTGVVGTVSCPAAAVSIEEPAWSSVVATDRQAAVVAPSAANGHTGNGWGNGHYPGNGTGPLAARLDQPSAPDYAPEYTPSPSSRVDELFGPMVDLQQENVEDEDGTPIFAAIASAWFREDRAEPEPAATSGSTGDPLDWETPSDTEWREAAARAAQPDPLPSTPSGLPRRRPGTQLVPPPRSQTPPSSEPTERVPDRVRNRLSTYQRGLRQGRHRAPGPEAEQRW